MDRDIIAGSIGYSFKNSDLLRQALTHRSYGASHYERLEFLGDSVLNCVIAAELFARFPQLAEGELSRRRASFVNQQSLCETAQNIGLGAQLLLGEGELKSGGAQRPSILADALEALIGAIFVDGGFEAAREFILRCFESSLVTADPLAHGKDAKTTLQELLQARRMPLPQYSVISTAGDAHEQIFCVGCAIPGLGISTRGEATSRRGAEQEAARLAYDLAIRS